ncbi:site-specific integrase [Pseudoalteromonas sp. S558]|uniref:site-specific integrase n=1 Tax=Pseudoalteromonas sp. S558 TaxID=2066515 RepID=UPI00110C0DC0|nr:site-specific integrase [Pseudoalteromonas sp. S558]TMO05489.1 site-specific integrase [Pseudoalteromonas sp. S558]
MKISVYPVGSRRFITFVNEYQIPVEPLANAFIYEHYLNASFSTKIRIANELKIVLEYFQMFGIKLDKRIASGELLSASEISHFYGQMMLRKGTFGNTKKISSFSTITDKNIRNAIVASQHSSAKVSTGTRTGRLRTLRNYLEYLFIYYHDDRIVPSILNESFAMMVAKLKAKERYSFDHNPAHPVQLVESVIPDEIYKQLHQIVLPSNLLNPYRSNKLRNYLVFSLLDQTGMRRSELCKLKISDCQFHDSYNKIKVYSTPDDKDDPRLNRPNQKSGRPHMSGIKVSLMKELEFYIKHERSKYKYAKTHDFVFVSGGNSKNTSGLPISRELINYMFSRLSKHLNFKINPHLLRHKWNENLSIKAALMGYDREQTEDLRRNAMGWEPDSNMGRVYNDKHEQLIAIELMTKHQGTVDGSE